MRHYSEETIKTYSYVFQKFDEVCKVEDEKITTQDVVSYLMQLGKENACHNKFASCCLNVIFSFYVPVLWQKRKPRCYYCTIERSPETIRYNIQKRNVANSFQNANKHGY